MLALMDQVRDPLVATDEEAIIAREAAEKLKPLADAKADVKLRVLENINIIVPLPARAVEMIVDFLLAMAERKPVSVLPHTAELTTQQAADFLNVSRPHLVGLVEKGEVAFRKVGTHRRIRVSDLFAFKKKSEETGRSAIRNMVAEAQKLELP
jgi:excisionase family DNA binding protein